MGIRAEAFAAVYDRVMARTERAGLAEERLRLLEDACGRVLEVGGGTGANLPFYRDCVSELVVAEPEPPMARRLVRRLAASTIPASVVIAPAERLPLATASFDCAVATLVLCTVRDLPLALAELHRVLRPGAPLFFLEHVRSEDPGVARWQGRLRRPWSWIAQGCQLDRDTVQAIGAAGFSVAALRRDRLPHAPPFAAPLAVGTAIRAGPRPGA